MITPGGRSDRGAFRRGGFRVPADGVKTAGNAGILRFVRSMFITASAGQRQTGMRLLHKDLCESLSVPLCVAYCHVPAYAAEHGLSEEEAGRILRYQVLEKEAGKWEQELPAGSRVKIALAHHRDDNAETILHHLLRGSGLTGLAGIRPVQGRRIRPLLCVGREEIRAYLEAEHIRLV